MLTSELLMHRVDGGVIVPKALDVNAANLELAAAVIALFVAHHGRERGELDDALREFEGDGTDYRVRRGLAHLLYSERCEFSVRAPLEPPALRERVFALAARSRPRLHDAGRVLVDAALELGRELGREVRPSEVAASLYADLREHHVIAFDAPEPAWLVNRYNLAQAQGVLYRASELVITAHRNDPGEYKMLFRYLKLFGLMHRVTGDADAGYTIVLDGPASLFRPSTRYGLAFAKFLPALLHATRWTMDALVHPRRAWGDDDAREAHYLLDASTPLVSHYAKGKVFDSILEHGFSARWERARTEWRLEREVDLVDLGGTVLIPDFRLVHPDGRAVLVEIVGFWRPEYLRRKIDKVRRSGRDDLVLAVSSRLKLEEAGVSLDGLEDRVVWFKGALEPRAVLEAVERVRAGRASPL